MKRRTFVQHSALGIGAMALPTLMFHPLSKASSNLNPMSEVKISLAQWSLHRSFFSKKLDVNDFAKIAKETYGIHAVEYVNQFYKQSAKNEKFWLEMKKRADDIGVKSLLIMTDGEGNLGGRNKRKRKKAVKKHYKWVDAAKLLGCHSIRVNAFGDKEEAIYKAATIEGMGMLAEYAAKENINIIIENHGLYSSNAKLIVDIVKEVNMSNFGTFPDFGNWCTSVQWGSTQRNCESVYDIYQGVKEFLPYAKAVSAKSYDFNDKGEDTRIDYFKMMKLVKESGYTGHIGVEYEGSEKSEHDGILATKALIEKAWKNS